MVHFLSDTPPPAVDIEDALLDFGFYHHLRDVKRMYAEHQNHGNLGYPGGVLDQPEEYWDDMATMHWLELWVKHVADLPRLEQKSVFDTLRDEDRFDGNWLTHDHSHE